MEVSDSFMPQQLYPRGKSPQYPLDRKLSGPQSQSGHGGKEKNPCWESKPSCPACSLVNILHYSIPQIIYYYEEICGAVNTTLKQQMRKVDIS
jgi:hypothetical protein